MAMIQGNAGSSQPQSIVPSADRLQARPRPTEAGEPPAVDRMETRERTRPQSGTTAGTPPSREPLRAPETGKGTVVDLVG